jgi:signal-transduction protein with cAMP-binding, CBS, and nucleotidyltransferase domain
MSDTKAPVRRARDVMSTNLILIDGMTTAREAATHMREAKVEALVVDKRHADDAYGLIAIQDLITGVVSTGRSPDNVNVYEIMTKPVISVPASMDIRYVVRMLIQANIRRAPVEENGNYIGMISLNELIYNEVFF